MQIDEKLIEGLTKIGLQRYQAQVYIASVVLGEASAYLIAKESNVPRAKVYEVIDSLVDLGFMAKIPSDKGMLFSALPPEDTIDNAISQIVSTINGVKREIGFLQEKQENRSSDPPIVIFNNNNAFLDMLKDGDIYEGWVDNKLDISNEIREILQKKKSQVRSITSTVPLAFILGPDDSYFIRGLNGSQFMIKFSNKIIQQILGLVEKSKLEYKEEITRESGVRILRETAIMNVEDRIKLIVPGFTFDTEKMLFWGIVDNISGSFESHTPIDCFITDNRILVSADDGRVWARALKFIQKIQLLNDQIILTFTKVGGKEILIITSAPYATILENLISFILKKQ
ncbi:MAG: helix-turn-helix domain-containing protein [Candidatus Heimdallarchaeota archaeon]|nr:helix-turn-helix domain-containing protein [Candidatus Heimdallarchaeota archaeon]